MIELLSDEGIFPIDFQGFKSQDSWFLLNIQNLFVLFRNIFHLRRYLTLITNGLNSIKLKYFSHEMMNKIEE